MKKLIIMLLSFGLITACDPGRCDQIVYLNALPYDVILNIRSEEGEIASYLIPTNKSHELPVNCGISQCGGFDLSFNSNDSSYITTSDSVVLRVYSLQDTGKSLLDADFWEQETISEKKNSCSYIYRYSFSEDDLKD